MNANTIQKIKDYYKPYLKNDTTLTFITKDNKERHVPIGHAEIFLSFGEKVTSKEDAIEKGVLVTTGRELHKVLFPDFWESVKHKYEDDRTEKYLEVCKNNIGLIEVKHGWDEEVLIEKREYQLYGNSSPLEIGKNESGQWVAQFGYRTNIDDYNVERMFFSKKPNVDVVKMVRTISDIFFFFDVNGYDKSTFRCWECGCTAHWLDNKEGDITEKFERLKDKYCGC